jgi:hypothetical protein
MMASLQSLWQRRTVTLTLALTTKETMMEELRMTLSRIQMRFPREMPLRSSCQLRRFHWRRRHTRWSSPRMPQR